MIYYFFPKRLLNIFQTRAHFTLKYIKLFNMRKKYYVKIMNKNNFSK